jgi:F420-0:gamma-glutamyl ligase
MTDGGEFGYVRELGQDVVCVADHFVSPAFHRLIEIVQIDVGQQGTDYTSRRTAGIRFAYAMYYLLPNASFKSDHCQPRPCDSD